MMVPTWTLRRDLSIVPVLIIILLSMSGCATINLNESIQRTPRADARRYPVLIEGRYEGGVKLSGKSYDQYYFDDIIWKAPQRVAGIYVLVPAEGENGEAIIMSFPMSVELVLACRGPSAQNATNQVQHSAKMPAYAYFTLDEGEPNEHIPFDQIPKAKTTVDYPVVLSVVMENPKHPKSLFTVRPAIQGQPPTALQLSKPHKVRECLVQPTEGQNVLRHIGFLGYLVTVPVDIVTSPLQLLIYVIAVNNIDIGMAF